MKIEKKSAVVAGSYLGVLLLLISSVAAFGQAGRGSISGAVTDQTGAMIPKASVTLLDLASGVTRHATSNAAGDFAFVSLNPGSYRVTASHPNFVTVVHDHVQVSVDQTTTVNLALHVGGVDQVVTVEGTADLTESTNSTVGQLITAATIDRVPLLTRDVYDLVQLSPGVTPANGAPNSSNSQSIASITSGRPGIDVSSYTINGAIVGSVYYMVDGSPIGVSENNAATILPAMVLPEDAVEETRVETQNTPASYQSGAAGVISLATKSGGNRFHGDIFRRLPP